MPTVIGLFDDRTAAMRAYDTLLSGGFRSAELDILANDDQDDVPKLARLGDSVPEPDVQGLWEEQNPGSWAQLKDAVRFSWERVRGTR